MIKSFSKEKLPLLKALLALLIVADHLTFHVDLAWLKPFRELGAPIVSVFFFVSGYGLFKSYTVKGKEYLDGFFVKRILKVIVPALVALLVYWLVSRPQDILENIKLLFIKGIPILPYSWFAEVIILLYLGFWICFRYVSTRFRITAVWGWAFLSIAIALALGYDRCWWVCNLAFPAGMTYCSLESRLPRVATIVLSTATALFLYLTGNPYCYILCYVFIPVVVAEIVSILPFEKCSGRVIAFLAGISYEIYLCQGIAMDAFRGGILNIGNDYLYIVVVYVFTILVSWLVNIVSSSCLKALK